MTGSRDWDDTQTIVGALWGAADGIPSDEVTVVSGACPTGADALAELAAERAGVTVERHPAQWKRPDGSVDKSAGFRRNQEMVDLGADICLAFIRGGSKGATHTAGLAEAAGIRTIRYIA